MGLRELQSALARLFTDAELRRRHQEDPRSLGIALGIGEEEMGQWLALSSEQIANFSDGLLRKRLAAVRSLLPRTAKRLGNALDESFYAWAQTVPSQGMDHHLRDAWMFGDHLLSQNVASPWERELIRWERALVGQRLGRCAFRWLRLRYDVTDSARDGAGDPPACNLDVLTIACFGYRRLFVRRGRLRSEKLRDSPSGM